MVNEIGKNETETGDRAGKGIGKNIGKENRDGRDGCGHPHVTKSDKIRP